MRRRRIIRAVALVAMAVAMLWMAAAQAAQIPGRVAISSDGNKHDCDDIFASAVAIAILASTGNAGALRYYGYADHHWATSEGCNGGDREYEMNLSTQETARLYGGFDLTRFVNARAERDRAVEMLLSEINVSTATNPLWIIAAGPMDIVGRALSAADSNRRKYVTLISHSKWNDEHADRPGKTEQHSGWTWNEIGRLKSPPNMTHLPDQNNALKTSHSTYYSWRDSTDERLQWLWNRNVVAGKDWPDCSDAGMTFWLATGQTSDQRVTPGELKALLQN